MSLFNQTLQRSNDNIISGVIGGFAAHFNVPPILLRLATVFLMMVTGILPGVITYIVAFFIMEKPKPTRPKNR